MKALTIWQPWASLIVAGAKPYEFRGWYPPRAVIGQRIWLHAGARPVRRDEVADLLLRLDGAEAWTTALRPELARPLLQRALTSPGSLPLASILGSAVLGRPVSGHDAAVEFGGQVNDSDRREHANWAWPMLDIEPLEPPLPARGAQGLWDWSEAA